MLYKIERQEDGVKLFKLDGDRSYKEISPEYSLKIRNHSPAGFETGYCGSGPAQLALALLLDYFTNVYEKKKGEEYACKYYQQYKIHEISKIKVNIHYISKEGIVRFLKQHDFTT